MINIENKDLKEKLEGKREIVYFLPRVEPRKGFREKIKQLVTRQKENKNEKEFTKE